MHFTASLQFVSSLTSSLQQGNIKRYYPAWGAARATPAQRTSIIKGAYVPARGGREA